VTRLEAIRRHVLAHAPTCKRLARLYSDEEALRVALSGQELEGHLRAAAGLSRDDLERLIAPLISEGGEPPPASETDVQTVRMQACYG
jgi:hypothetical protein